MFLRSHHAIVALPFFSSTQDSLVVLLLEVVVVVDAVYTVRRCRGGISADSVVGRRLSRAGREAVGQAGTRILQMIL